MNETSIKSISSVRSPEASTPFKPLVTNQADTMTTQKPGHANSDTTMKQIEVPAEQGENVSNVSIHFRLDDKTNELTVFVVDRKTKRVLRSIPASELHKLQAGELLKLTA
jgi:uncharacterized FlaG/YvyC family protein